MIAGLEETNGGDVIIGGRNVTQVDAADRGIAMVFQTYALYLHMTVRENMGLGLKMNCVDKATTKSKVDGASAILKLEDYMDRKPAALSGGQRQRVAIGRALVRDPDVFLFDEPLSNLDAELRVDMRVEIARLHHEIGATMIYVTHDQVEAMTLADKIVVLRAGHVEQVGSPMELYTNPSNKFVAGFIGSPSMIFVKGVIKDGQITADARPGSPNPKRPMTCVIRVHQSHASRVRALAWSEVDLKTHLRTPPAERMKAAFNAMRPKLLLTAPQSV